MTAEYENSNNFKNLVVNSSSSFAEIKKAHGNNENLSATKELQACVESGTGVMKKFYIEIVQMSNFRQTLLLFRSR